MCQLLVLFNQLRNFTLFWLGQSLSQIGTRLTGFGLGIWVYQTTHAVTQLSLVFFITTLPGVLLTPFIGALVDRWNRRWIIFCSDCVAALVTLVLVVLLMQDQLQVWHTYISAFVTSLCGSFQMLAKGAAVPMMVPKQQLGRVNGLIQFSTALSEISAPALAGLLIATVDLDGLLWIDLASYGIGLLTLLFVTIPQPEPEPTSLEQKRSILQEIADGWKIVSSQFALIILLVFMGVHFFVNGMTNVLLNPLILSFSTAQIFGSVMSIGGSGMVAGSILMSFWGGGSNALASLLVASSINGVGLVVTGLRPSPAIIACGIFVSFFTLPIILATHQVIWQTYTKPSFQGRVLSLVGAFTGLLAAFGNISASPLADVVLEPMFLEDGILASTVGQLIDTGQGRGIGFLVILEGCLIVLVSIVVYSYIRWQHLDQQLMALGEGFLGSDIGMELDPGLDQEVCLEQEDPADREMEPSPELEEVGRGY